MKIRKRKGSFLVKKCTITMQGGGKKCGFRFFN
ncbi:hypothetical protein CHY_1833 [Carboxydothermus hydrogenoformans Z-2901]|uniref:Uncharacterized protein n=1 Tax=Carboxydothermus hydrogenoformans (strain ATCC BAA-161 / DSM 6008 / Z-2901) TaxID=246194 RepID=Q3AB31_CARHZ|nr:hypothetical protein CHY_1833 [Carboxydothermus hydrogenoformans Z-2901]